MMTIMQRRHKNFVARYTAGSNPQSVMIAIAPHAHYRAATETATYATQHTLVDTQTVSIL